LKDRLLQWFDAVSMNALEVVIGWIFRLKQPYLFPAY